MKKQSSSMTSVKYNILSSGSKGNAVIIENKILIDCGVPYKALSPFINNLSLVLLTHIHSDHFNRRCIKNLASNRPTLRFACGEWLIMDLIECGINKSRIDILNFSTCADYGIFKIIPIPLVHNVPTMGFKIKFSNNRKVIYATDTNSLNGVTAKNFDLYMIECNYEDEEIKNRINDKLDEGEYAYEVQVINNHLSKAKCDEFLLNNMGTESEYVYMHMHEDG